MKNNFRILINSLPANVRIPLAKIYFSYLLKRGKLESLEIEYKMLNRWIKEGDICLDIGANIGRYTIKMSKIVGNKGHVFSFEPMKESFNILTHLCGVVNATNITLINAAVGDNTELIEMHKEYLPKTSKSLIDTNTASYVSSNTQNLCTLCISIDSFEFPDKVSIVKIDVEGYEVHVLNGMKKLIRRDKPNFIVESNGKQRNKPNCKSENNSNNISDFFYKMGYSLLKMERKSRNEFYFYNG